MLGNEADAILNESEYNNDLDEISQTDTVTTNRSVDDVQSRGTRVPHSSGQQRRPFHLNPAISIPPNSSRENLVSPTPETTNTEELAIYQRYKYYQRLRQYALDDNALLIPDHVIPCSFFYPYIPGTAPLVGKQSSIITIFAVWNTMMGTSLLSMPWAIQHAGFAMGLLLMVVMASVCSYTAYRILCVYKVYGESENLPDFPDLCRFLLGKWGYAVSIVFSALSLLGAATVYWVLMSNFLYYTGKYIHDQIEGDWNPRVEPNNSYSLLCLSSSPNETQPVRIVDDDLLPVFDKVWNLHTTVPIYLAALLVPLLCFKSPTFFTKFNALGTLSVAYIVGFVITKASQWGFHANFTDDSSPFYVSMLEPSFPALSGMLSLALFLHNCIITIMKNNRNQENNTRDLGIAYGLVTVTYMGIGTVFYLAFPLAKSCIEDNFLNNFPSSDIMTTVARVFLLFQMITVFPLLAYILRAQLLHAIYSSAYPSLCHVMGLNCVLLAVCVVFAVFLPQVGTITRFSGALCGLVYIFALPSLLYVVMQKRQQGKWPILSTSIHSCILLVGIANFVAQFAISD